MIKQCTKCQSSFEISEPYKKILKNISETLTQNKTAIPLPKLCPPCRLQRRLSFRNDRHFYHTKSALSGTPIISIFSPHSKYKSYSQEEWWKDNWSPLDYGKDFDFTRPFFDQFQELMQDVPHNCLYNSSTENSTYNNYAINLKNCYLLFGAAKNENCLYGKYVVESQDCIDSLCIGKSELCYESTHIQDCYNCQYITYSKSCNHCFMVENCQSCEYCILCFGLRGKKYYILNTYVGKEKFEQFKKQIFPLTHKKIEKLQNKLLKLKKDLPHPQWYIVSCENTTGNMLLNCKNCRSCFNLKNGENLFHCSQTPNAFMSLDCTFAAPDGIEYAYEICSSTGTKNSLSCFLCWHCQNALYSIECHQSQNILGCVGLQHKKYCILNKQYSKNAFHRLCSKIIHHMKANGEWGEFFPMHISPFAYNETNAFEYFPLSEQEVRNQSLQWENKVFSHTSSDTTKKSIKTESQNVRICEITKKPFKIAPQELEFYKKHGIPIPKKHPDQRHKERLAKENNYVLHTRNCSQCTKNIQTIFSQKDAKKVLCEACYLQEMY